MHPRHRLLLFPLLFLALSISISSSSSSPSHSIKETKEARALLNWKSTLSEPDALGTWSLVNSVSLCTLWNGVTCDAAGSVASLKLPFSQINGTLQGLDFASLPRMEEFDISGNSFTGEIPPELFSNWSHLIYFDVSQNRITGRIPREIGLATELRFLYLSSNQLSGPIPLEIGNLSYLTHLEVSMNSLPGSIPRTIGKLNNLRRVILANNHLSGPIPLEIGDLSHLYELDISHDNLTFVVGIDLSGNHLTGEIPKEILNLSGMVLLDLSRNNLNGSIPERIDRLKQLEILDLSTNHLSGIIPPSITSLTLFSLNLSYNNLSGRIPSISRLQIFDYSSVYGGNDGLCGPPLSKTCGDYNATFNEEVREELVEKIWSYLSVEFGFIVGFWIFMGTLCLKKSWRVAYFHAIDDMQERVLKHKIA